MDKITIQDVKKFQKPNFAYFDDFIKKAFTIYTVIFDQAAQNWKNARCTYLPVIQSKLYVQTYCCNCFSVKYNEGSRRIIGPNPYTGPLCLQFMGRAILELMRLMNVFDNSNTVLSPYDLYSDDFRLLSNTLF